MKSDLPREVLKADLLYSLGATMTVCEISRNNALKRLEVIVKTGKDPGYEADHTKKPAELVEETGEIGANRDYERLARDEIERKIASAFDGIQFQELIAQILRAQGYIVPPLKKGADGSIDILAGSGSLGLLSPRLIVEVKSGAQVADHKTLEALRGAVQSVGADHGLLASWGGFTKAVLDRERELHFKVRLWNRAKIMDALLDVYDKLPEEIRAELPLKRFWALVPDIEQSTA